MAEAVTEERATVGGGARGGEREKVGIIKGTGLGKWLEVLEFRSLRRMYYCMITTHSSKAQSKFLQRWDQDH